MADLRFTKGDVVRLKSGGPTMTVKQADYADEIICIWFDDKGAHQKLPFDQETLDLFTSGPLI